MSAETFTVKKRRRFKQTTTLAERLTAQAGRLRSQARRLPPGTEQIELLRKIRQAEAALRIEEWLASRESRPPSSVVAMIDEDAKKRVSHKASYEST
jgi:hypothetical protein